MTPTPPPTPDRPVLDDAALRRWLFRARDDLARLRGRIDALNVYPVPDGDTGTNLHLTLDDGVRGFLDSLTGPSAGEGRVLGAAEASAALARSMLYAARGNSGVILSRLVSGLAHVLAGPGREGGLDGPGLAEALAEADVRARAAVAEPVEGTILTVARSAARAAGESVRAGRARLSQVVDAACSGAREALAATPTQLETLARAGVVDAGGAGLVVVLDALAAVLHGDDTPPEPAWLPHADAPSAAAPAGPVTAFEVMYLLDDLDDAGAHRLTERLTRLGDSVVVAGDTTLRTVHVHTDDAGAAIEAGLRGGRPYAIRVAVLPDRRGGPCPSVVDPPGAVTGEPGSAPTGPDDGVGLVVCTQAPGLRPVFEDAGAVVVLDAPGARSTPADLVTAAHATGRRHVVVLPDDGDLLPAAEAARDIAAEDGLHLDVVPTRHLLQGVAAVAVYDAGPACVDRMRETGAAVRCGGVARATRPAVTDAGECRIGDVVGFADGRVVHVGDDARTAALAVVSALAGDGTELVTLVEGGDADGLAGRVAPDLEDDGLDVEVLHGGQSVYDLLIGVE